MPDSYEEGLRDGKLQSLENMMSHHTDRLDSQEKRITILERVAWSMLGIVGFIEFWPKLQGFV